MKAGPSARTLFSGLFSGPASAVVIASGGVTAKSGLQVWFYQAAGYRSVTGATSCVLRVNGQAVARSDFLFARTGEHITGGLGIGVTRYPAGTPLTWQADNNGNVFSDATDALLVAILEL